MTGNDIYEHDNYVFYIVTYLNNLGVYVIYQETDTHIANKTKERLALIMREQKHTNLFLIDKKEDILINSNFLKLQNQKISALSSGIQDVYRSMLANINHVSKDGFYTQNITSDTDNTFIYAKDIGNSLVIGVSTSQNEITQTINIIKDRLKEDMSKNISVSVFITVLLIALFVVAGLGLKYKIKQIIRFFLKRIDDAKNKSTYIGTSNTSFKEFHELSDIINELIESKIYHQTNSAKANNELNLLISLLDTITMIFRLDNDGKIITANNNACKILKYTRTEIIGMNFKDIFTISDINSCLWQGLLKATKKDGKACYTKTSIQSKPQADESIETLVISYDITSYVTQKERLDDLMSDALTKLPNQQALIIKTKESQQYSFMANFDILKFKYINECYGINISNKVLIAIADRLKSIINGKNLELFKLSNDGFALIGLKKFWSLYGFVDFAKIIIDNFNNMPIMIDDNEFYIELVFGISSDTSHFMTAQLAKDYAKANNQNIAIFDEQKQNLQNAIKLTHEIKKAIQDNRTIVHKQAVIDRQNNKVYECLIRILDENGTTMLPAEFLQIAKHSNLYTDLSKIVIQKAFEYFGKNNDEFSINLDIDDISSPEVTQYLKQNLQNNENLGSRLTVEISEAQLVQNYEKVYDFIQELRPFGCKIAIDNFGEKYSNFKYLTRIKADFIKIDSSLIANIHKNKVVVEAIIDFAKRIGVKTIAKYVHSDEIAQILKATKIDAMQGYLYDTPKPLSE
ncbi:hypothetical protein LMG7974_01237 [Campylobacter majalis]|uniref:EAL domain-containing protein n=1 Tax=Campylobacter majalis TaxID=2790656 RepID=A0ABM8Q7H6_9BACT|nr:EAL domain-containing protein [Campylobacter majalis]CAD7288926.1 hypothetical protein LMG7974_01237 [Campylobacter majalis]